MSNVDFNTYINDEMYNRRNEVLNKIKKIVHPKYAEEFSTILHYSWQENLPEAEKITESLDLFPIDFSALALDIQSFKPLFIQEREDEYIQYYT